MHRIEPHCLWLGNAGDLRSPRGLFDADIQAVIDLAANEPFPQLPRELTYCRFPLLDGAGNEPQLLILAISTASKLLSTGIPTLICCSNGLSRSPAIAAAAIALIRQTSLDDELSALAAHSRFDVTPALWKDVKDACSTA